MIPRTFAPPRWIVWSIHRSGRGIALFEPFADQARAIAACQILEYARGRIAWITPYSSTVHARGPFVETGPEAISRRAQEMRNRFDQRYFHARGDGYLDPADYHDGHATIDAAEAEALAAQDIGVAMHALDKAAAALGRLGR